MSDLERKLDQAIMETIWINKIDDQVRQRVHPFWFNANGQTFTFGIDVDRVKQAFIDAGWSKQHATNPEAFAELTQSMNQHLPTLLTGQEWLDKTLRAVAAHVTDNGKDYIRSNKDFRGRATTVGELEGVLQEVAKPHPSRQSLSKGEGKVMSKRKSNTHATPYAKQKMIEALEFDLYRHTKFVRIVLLDDDENDLLICAPVKLPRFVHAGDRVWVELPKVEVL
jgi:hypothetical protein